MDKPKREAILDLAKYVNERIRVKFTGGREGRPVLHSATLTRALISSVGQVSFPLCQKTIGNTHHSL